jgi:nicotinamidase-related amidase
MVKNIGHYLIARATEHFAYGRNLRPASRGSTGNQILDVPTAVLLIDMQEEFLDDIDPYEKDRIIGKQKEVLGICINGDIPVAALRCSGVGNIISELSSMVYEVPRHCELKKTEDDGFDGTDLESTLRNWDVEKCFLMGINADGCVRRTGRGAVARRFQIATSDDVIAEPLDWIGEKGKYWFVKNGDYYNKYEEFLSASAETNP